MLVRWNSTYLMLQNAIDYADIITGFYNFKKGSQILSQNDWYVAKTFIKFLKVFNDSIVLLSRVYYPTSSLVIYQIVEMSEMFAAYRDDGILGSAVVAIKVKFKKHWSEIPFLYDSGLERLRALSFSRKRM